MFIVLSRLFPGMTWSSYSKSFSSFRRFLVIFSLTIGNHQVFFRARKKKSAIRPQLKRLLFDLFYTHSPWTCRPSNISWTGSTDIGSGSIESPNICRPSGTGTRFVFECSVWRIPVTQSKTNAKRQRIGWRSDKPYNIIIGTDDRGIGDGRSARDLWAKSSTRLSRRHDRALRLGHDNRNNNNYVTNEKKTHTHTHTHCRRSRNRIVQRYHIIHQFTSFPSSIRHKIIKYWKSNITLRTRLFFDIAAIVGCATPIRKQTQLCAAVYFFNAYFNAIFMFFKKIFSLVVYIYYKYNSY